VGQLKTSVSHLQFENEQLKTELAKLKDEQRAAEDRLVQEQIHNGDLAARLDDARNLLRDRGLDLDEGGSQARTLPAGRKTHKPRKPPAAQIGGDLNDLPAASDEQDQGNPSVSFRSSVPAPRRRIFPDDPPSSSSSDDQLRWQPVATGPAAQAAPRR
jgi:hypothetical protein